MEFAIHCINDYCFVIDGFVQIMTTSLKMLDIINIAVHQAFEYLVSVLYIV